MLKKLPYMVIGLYEPPPGVKAWQIGRIITSITKAQGLVPFPRVGGKNNTKAAWSNKAAHAEARLTADYAEGSEWHQDGDNTPGADMDHALVLWAASSPPEVRAATERHVYQVEPYNIVIFRNKGCYHRRPPSARGFRYSFRQRVEVPEWLVG